MQDNKSDSKVAGCAALFYLGVAPAAVIGSLIAGPIGLVTVASLGAIGCAVLALGSDD